MEKERSQTQTLMDVIEDWTCRRPEWFVDCNISVDETDPDAWAPILSNAFDDIERLVSHDPHYEFRITQIKEKLHTLRVYFRRDIENETDLKIEAVLEMLRTISENHPVGR